MAQGDDKKIYIPNYNDILWALRWLIHFKSRLCHSPQFVLGGGVSWWVMRRAEGGMGRAAASLKLMEVWEERSLCCMPVSVPMAMPTQRARRAGANKVALPLSHLGWACRIVTTPLFVRGAVCSYLRQRSKEIKRCLLSLEDCVFNLS